MKCWLTVHQNYVPVGEVSMDLFISRATGAITARSQQLIRQSEPLICSLASQIENLPILALDRSSSRPYINSIYDSLLHLLEIMTGDRLRKGQFLGKDGWYTDLIGLDVGVGRDDTACSEVDTLPHHILSEESFFLFRVFA